MSVTNRNLWSARKHVDAADTRFAEEVGYYLSLTPSQLPSHYLYDALGSALFEAICHLPWYPLTRAETTLVARHAPDVFAALRGVTRVIELGSGSGDKLATLLRAGRRTESALELHLVDVSAAALEVAARALGEFDRATIVSHHATYEVGLQDLHDVPESGRALVLFLGSNIGNFDPPGADAMLRHIRAALAAGDGLLLGADLVKPEAQLQLAYDDPLGVTAAFNLNLLARINRDLDANFDLDAFVHRAVWNATASRIEMHLVSRRDQRIEVPPARIDRPLAEGDFIWTESSYKYEAEDLRAMLERNGFRVDRQWIEPDARFALTLALAV